MRENESENRNRETRLSGQKFYNFNCRTQRNVLKIVQLSMELIYIIKFN